MYDYLLGGKDSFAVDRSVADELIAIFPELAELVAENRQFVARASAWAARQGVRQFLDLGCGMPAEPTTHDVVQAVDAAAKVVYVDCDRVTISHLRALSEHGHEGVVSVIEADVRDVPGVLKDVSGSLDLSQPACVILGCLLHLFPAAEARAVVAGYIAALVPGSYLDPVARPRRRPARRRVLPRVLRTGPDRCTTTRPRMPPASSARCR